MLRHALLAVSLAVACTLSGCYHYDARATNLSSQNVSVSLHKGRKHVELSSAVLPPGSSLTWEGDTNGPVFMRFAALGETVDVDLPRRKHAELSASTESGELEVTTTVDGVEVPPEETDDDADDDDAEHGNEGQEEEAVDLVEPEDR